MSDLHGFVLCVKSLCVGRLASAPSLISNNVILRSLGAGKAYVARKNDQDKTWQQKAYNAEASQAQAARAVEV